MVGLRLLQAMLRCLQYLHQTPSYYGQGVGTATTNLYDPTKIDPYLASLYGITPSPIGATYDAADSSYSMPNSRKDAKSRTRLRGLDIFKPVSIVS